MKVPNADSCSTIIHNDGNLFPEKLDLVSKHIFDSLVSSTKSLVYDLILEY